MSEFGEDLVESLTEAIEFARGSKTGARIRVVGVPDVRAIRLQLRMSQREFSDAFRISLSALRDWEHGRRVPDAPAAAHLQVIARLSEMIRYALREG